MSRSHAATTRHWQRHVDRWRRGSLSKSDYCDKHGLVASSFQRWILRLGDSACITTAVSKATPASLQVTLIPVQLHEDVRTPDCVVARASNVEISLPVSLDAAQVRTYLFTAPTGARSRRLSSG